MNNQTIQAATNALKKVPHGIYDQPAPREAVKLFYRAGDNGVVDALEQCQNEGYKALFMP